MILHYCQLKSFILLPENNYAHVGELHDLHQCDPHPGAEAEVSRSRRQ